MSMKRQKRFLILTEAGKGIGYGHFTRCVAIQKNLIKEGHFCRMLLETSGVLSLETTSNIEVESWLKASESLICNNGFDGAIIDSYRVNAESLKYIRSLFQSVIVLDDFNRIRYPADLIINPNVYGKNIDYSNQSACVAGGPEYVVCREIFSKNRSMFTVRKVVRNILLTFGGDDYRELMPKFIKKYNSGGYNLSIITGSEPYKRNLSKLARDTHRIFGFVDEGKMASLMQEADIAITAAGQTLHELSCLGVPTIGICIDEDQRLNIQSYADNGFLVCPLYWDDPTLMIRLDRVLTYLADEEARRTRSKRGQLIVDGKGAVRISNLLCEEVRKNS